MTNYFIEMHMKLSKKCTANYYIIEMPSKLLYYGNT